MAKYIVKRLLLAIPIFLGITLIVFILANKAPGSPLDIISASSNLNPEQLEALKVSLGLDQPVLVRYARWLMDLLHGDLGISSKNVSVTVWSMIQPRIGPSLLLSLSGMFFAVIFGVTLGVVSSLRPYSIGDKLASVVAFIGTSMPGFFFALLLIFVFSVKLGWFPASGMYNASQGQTLPDLIYHLILPVFIMTLQSIGSYIKQTRSSMLDVLNQDYIKTARAKGISEVRVTVLHGLRNALMPIVTQMSLSVPWVIGGAVVTEQIFGWPGLGSLMVTAVSSRDYNVIMGITVLIAVVVLCANILLDIVYTYLDPRIGSEV